MLRKTSIMHGAVVGTALALMAAGTVSPALADPPSHSNASVKGQQHSGAQQGGSGANEGKKDKPKKAKKPQKDKPAQSGKPAKPSTSKPAQSKPAPSKPAQAKPAKSKPAQAKPSQSKPAQAGGSGDPAGNNGTVKIAPLGELDGIPDNSPHPGCTFQVEWYGFDEGPDVVSTVSFAMHAPTADVGLGVDGPATVFVGGDPASGAGTDSGLDGTATYTLGFDGAPHPKQGYHVKLTVSTPRSQGNDSKTKVFWVEPCAAAPATPLAGAVSTTPDQGKIAPAGSGAAATTSNDDAAVLGAQATADDAVAGVEETADGTAADRAADVPSAVDAGENGRTFGEWARSPLPLLVVGLGLLITAGALVLRRRARA